MRQDLDIFTKEDEEGTNTQYNGEDIQYYRPPKTQTKILLFKKGP